jgi:hypothetical protein
MFKLLGNDNQLPAEVKNPFSMEHIQAIHMHCTKKLFSDGFNIRGTVEFVNGETKGEQTFEAEGLGELFVKIHNFCERLGVRR